MPTGVASDKQLAMMKRVLDAHCEAHGVVDTEARDDIAAKLIVLFNNGARTEQALADALTLERSRRTALAASVQ